MNKRAFERIPVNMRVKLENQNNNYSDYGTVTNLSEKGVFVSVNDLKFPLDSEIVISTISEKDSLEFSVVIKRIIKSPHASDGLGVEILSPPRKYLEYVDGLKGLDKS